MFDFRPEPGTPKPEAYRQLLDAAEALTAGEPDGVANMANIAALLWGLPARTQLVGILPRDGGRAGTRPVRGPACLYPDPDGPGACAAWPAKEGTTQLVEDVHAFPGHIACDAVTNSELVVPILGGGQADCGDRSRQPGQGTLRPRKMRTGSKRSPRMLSDRI